MSDAEMNAPFEERWQVFVLACCAPLGGFRHVHLAPGFPPGRLNLALRTEISFGANELLVALIENDAGGLLSSIILTTSRFYWTVREPEAGAGKSRRSVVLRSYGMDYALVPPDVRARATREGTYEILLGPGHSVPLLSADAVLAEALARCLRSLGEAARQRSAQEVLPVEADLEQRIRGVLPRVVEVTQRVRTLSRDLHGFRRDLMESTSRTWVTHTLTLACVVIYLVMVLFGVDPIKPTAGQLLAWGANDAERVALGHQWWRLPASVFLHGGLIHLAVNMWCLFSIGPLVERLFGNVAFAVIYLAAGIGGAIASMAAGPPRVSVGASGAIFGILGALLAFLLVHHHSVPASILRPLRSSALAFLVFNTLFGAAVPNIDQAAHMGGLAAGFLGGLALIRPWPVVRSRAVALRRLVIGVLFIGLLAAVVVLLVRYRARTLPAQLRQALAPVSWPAPLRATAGNHPPALG